MEQLCSWPLFPSATDDTYSGLNCWKCWLIKACWNHLEMNGVFLGLFGHDGLFAFYVERREVSMFGHVVKRFDTHVTRPCFVSCFIETDERETCSLMAMTPASESAQSDQYRSPAHKRHHVKTSRAFRW